MLRNNVVSSTIYSWNEFLGFRVEFKLVRNERSFCQNDMETHPVILLVVLE